MSFIKIIQGTPVYVWAILMYLLYVGIKATQKRTVRLHKLFLMPIIFFYLKYKAIIHNAANIKLYLLALILFAIIGYYIGYVRTQIKILKNIHSIELEGNYHTLFMILSIFCIRYTFGILHATNQSLALQYAWLEILTMGILTGFSLGKSLAYIHKYLRKK